MQPTKQFTGLTMPVFTAFGWAGEETAIQFALSQLELFIDALHAALSRDAQAQLPFHGLNRESQSVYLAANEDLGSGTHIAFYARPLTLEIILALTDKKALSTMLKAAEANPELWHRLVTELGPEWQLRVQQMEYNEEDGSAVHYQDLFKDAVDALDQETAKSVIVKAAFLNGESSWVIPVFLSRRIESEKAAAMGPAIVKVMSEEVGQLLPLVKFFTGKVRKSGGRAKGKSKAISKVGPQETSTLPPLEDDVDVQDQFSYVSELKPLHIRRGFVNLTPHHWPFFALNARTETRPVTIYYDGRYDRKSSVWRLVPDDQARIVLSAPVRDWLEENFAPNDKIQVIARKIDDNEIQLTLNPIE